MGLASHKGLQQLPKKKEKKQIKNSDRKRDKTITKFNCSILICLLCIMHICTTAHNRFIIIWGNKVRKEMRT